VAEEFLAAKVYRPRMFRNLRNDARYREGRPVLGPDSIEIDRSERRTMRALRKRTNYGMQVAHGSWLMHEYRALEEMHRAGADVPRPYAVSGNAILMSYHGDGRMAAPTLNTVQLPRQEAAALFERIVTNVEMALELGLVHGDLSAFNVLYWQGRITIIDWPQVTYCEGNHSARSILERDLVRICDHFQSQGVRCHAQRLLDRLWSRYGRPDVREAIADWSALHADSEEEEKQEGAE
jgi:RIO kinase 1